MKKIITKLIGILFLLQSLTVSSQEVFITNVQYQGVSTSNCRTINLGSASTHIITFDIRITRPYLDVSGNPNSLDESGVLKILYTTYYGTFEAESPTNINANSNWSIDTSNNKWVLEGTGIATLYSYQISESGGIIYAEYDTPNDYGNPYTSCDYSFTVPKFTISPTNVTIACGSTGETFIVTNENNSPGVLSYEWSIGSGWEYNGNAVSNFTTSTNTVILVPTSFPPSNVQVTPKLDGNPVLPQLTATVSLAAYNPSYTIIGDDSLCDTATYAINGLPSGTTITSWESSDTAIATVSAINNYEAVVTKVSDGSVTITATVQNSCGQTALFTKNINIGAPSFANVYITGDLVICSNQTKTYSVNIPSHPCIGTINWSVSSNLEIISQNYNTITIAPSTTNLENAGLISVSIPNSSFETTKGILVGLPSHTNGLTIQKIGSYNLYTGQWTKLKANYSVVVSI